MKFGSALGTRLAIGPRPCGRGKVLSLLPHGLGLRLVYLGWAWVNPTLTNDGFSSISYHIAGFFHGQKLSHISCLASNLSKFNSWNPHAELPPNRHIALTTWPCYHVRIQNKFHVYKPACRFIPNLHLVYKNVLCPISSKSDIRQQWLQ